MASSRRLQIARLVLVCPQQVVPAAPAQPRKAGVGKRLQAVVDPHPVLLADEWAAMKESGPKPIVRRATGCSPAWRARRSIRRGKYRYETACASLLRSL